MGVPATAALAAAMTGVLAAAGSAAAADVLTGEELSSLVAATALAGERATALADATLDLDLPEWMDQCPRAFDETPCPVAVIRPDGFEHGLLPVVSGRVALDPLPEEGITAGIHAYRANGQELRLLGSLATPMGSTVTPLTEEAMALAEGLPVGTVIAVDGWLNSQGLGLECPARAALDRAASSCPAEWLAASDHDPSAASTTYPYAPDVFAIRVSADAYDTFAPEPERMAGDATQPRRATYLLRQTSPAGADVRRPWTVVGRLDPVPEAAAPTATAESEGLLLELWLDRTSSAPGERLMAFTRISNLGAEAPVRQGNTCGEGPVPTTIQPVLPPDRGLDWTGNAAVFKELLLAEEWRPQGLLQAWMLDVGDSGCNAWGRDEVFAPGSVDQDVLGWDVVDRQGRPLQSGPATVDSRFETGRMGSGPRTAMVSLATQVEITGEPGAERSVVDYIDAGLGDERFRAWLDKQGEPEWWDPYASYWEGRLPRSKRYEGATDGAVAIGMSGPRRGEVVVDIPTLEILGRKLGR